MGSKKKKYRASQNANNVQDGQHVAQSYNDDLVEMPAVFAREMLKRLLYDPKNPSTRKSRTYSLYSEENVNKWLQNPTSSEKSLRDASNYMYLSSMQYRRLVSYYAGLPVGAYVISPLGYDGKPKNPKSFLKQYYKVSQALELMDIPAMIRDILTVTIREGVYYGARWGDRSSTFIQKLDADECRITHMSNGSFLYSVDCSKLSGRLEMYPPEFTTLYNEYLRTGNNWQLVPPEISVCIKADETITDYSIPPFAAVMPSLYTIANSSASEAVSDDYDNYKMITGKVPTDSHGNPTMDYGTYQKYYGQLASALGENVGLAITPFDLSTFTFEQQKGTNSVSKTSKAIGNFWSTAGTSGLLHGMANDKSGVTKLAIKNDETFIFGIVKQIEKVLNRYLRSSFSGSIKFKITILPVTVFNRDDYIKQYKEAVSFGLGKSYYAAALNIPQSDVSGLDFIEKYGVNFDSLAPLRNSYTGGTTGDNDPGRTPLEDGDLSDEGAVTRDNDTNANR